MPPERASEDIRAEDVRVKAAAAAEAVWRLSAPAPFDAVLRQQLRSSAAEVLRLAAGIAVRGDPARQSEARYHSGAVVPGEADRLSAAVSGVQELLGLAGRLGAIQPEHADRVGAAYRLIGQWAADMAAHGVGPSGSPRANSTAKADTPAAEGLNGRQRRILAYLAESRQAQIGDIRALFGTACSEKTLQRDLWQLVTSGLVRKRGENRWTTYISIGH